MKLFNERTALLTTANMKVTARDWAKQPEQALGKAQCKARATNRALKTAVDLAKEMDKEMTRQDNIA